MKSLTGNVYGRLTVVVSELHRRGRQQRTLWRCRCECGRTTVVETGNLIHGRTRSCGAAVCKLWGRGVSRTAEYESWCNAKARCYNRNVDNFADYGGRGIRMCDRWRGSFAAFLSDMGPRPIGLTLDRKDRNGPYAPDNCRWATDSEQANNRRNNHVVVYHGEARTIAEWARQLGLNRTTIHYRLAKGWSVQDAMTLGRRGSVCRDGHTI